MALSNIPLYIINTFTQDCKHFPAFAGICVQFLADFCMIAGLFSPLGHVIGHEGGLGGVCHIDGARPAAGVAHLAQSLLGDHERPELFVDLVLITQADPLYARLSIIDAIFGFLFLGMLLISLVLVIGQAVLKRRGEY